MIAGAVFGVGGLILPLYWQAHDLGTFPVNGQYMLMLASAMAIALYIGVSLATGGLRQPFNLERMLHRGIYSIDPHEHEVKSVLKNRWQELLGMGREFSQGDRFLTIVYAVTTLGTWAIFIGVCTAYYVFHAVADQFWVAFWHVYILGLAVISVPVLAWFTVGGVLDIRSLIQTLKSAVRDDTDDGRVMRQDSDLPPAPKENELEERDQGIITDRAAEAILG